jgi:ubiquinone/menaquinone biosynthesis C-methylase UbiE
MNNKQAYDLWSKQYDTDKNKTRDLEAKALRETLAQIRFDNCLEIGCGTGKNTEWLLQRTKHITAVDFSEEMLARAKEKINSDKVKFIQADITEKWNFTKDTFDLITFSLVLEHIENLNHIFKEAAKILLPEGYVYIGELHPFKQYKGTKARFETEEGLQILKCYTHHISDFIHSVKQNGFEITDLTEFWDEDDMTNVPRLFLMVLRKSN